MIHQFCILGLRYIGKINNATNLTEHCADWQLRTNNNLCVATHELGVYAVSM